MASKKPSWKSLAEAVRRTSLAIAARQTSLAKAVRQTSLLHPKEWLVWLGIAALWSFGQLPYIASQWSGRLLGRLIAPLLRARGRVAERNLALCFPELAPEERARLLKQNLQNSGLLLSEFAFAWCASKRASRSIPVQFHNRSALDDALASGRGVLLVGAHFSHLELCGRLLCEHTGAPVAGMYRPHRTAAMEYFVKRMRLRYAQAMFKRDELRAAIRWLKAGKVLWYAPDQDYKRGDTVFAPFFGHPAATLTATHQLAKMTGAHVLGFSHRRLPDGGYSIEFIGPLSDFPSADPEFDTGRVNEMLEAAIRAAPEQYLWLHKRFKSTPEGLAQRY